MFFVTYFVYLEILSKYNNNKQPITNEAIANIKYHISKSAGSLNGSKIVLINPYHIKYNAPVDPGLKRLNCRIPHTSIK